MRLLWPGVFFLSASWLFATPILGPPDWRGPACAACGLFLYGLAGCRINLRACSRSYAAPFLFLLPTVLLVPPYHRLGPTALMLGIVACALFRGTGLPARFFLGAAFGGLVLCLQSATFPLYSALAGRWHDMPALAPVIAVLARAFGVRASVYGSSVFAQGAQQTAEFTVTHEKLGVYALLCLVEAVALTLMLIERDRRSRVLLVTALCGLAWLPLRYTVLLLVSLEWNAFPLLWDRVTMALSLLPLAAICQGFAPLRVRTASEPLALTLRGAAGVRVSSVSAWLPPRSALSPPAVFTIQARRKPGGSSLTSDTATGSGPRASTTRIGMARPRAITITAWPSTCRATTPWRRTPMSLRTPRCRTPAS